MIDIATLFSNIGVADAYLADIGYNTSVACEIEDIRCKVHKYIYPKTEVICGDITDDNIANYFCGVAANIFLLAATPPCQGFSTLNAKKKDDVRNRLIFRTFDLVNSVKPKYFLVENVPQMLKAFDNRDVFESVKILLPDYNFNIKVLDAADFGVPQRRKRAILLFWQKGQKEWKFPIVDSRHITLKKSIGKLPSLESGESSNIHEWHFAQKHSDNHVKWMSHTPTGETAYDNLEFFPSVIENGTKRKIKGFANTYKRMSWDEPAPTFIKGSHMISSCNTVHPGRRISASLYSDARTLSVLEALIVMGLPVSVDEGGKVKDSWSFPKQKNNDFCLSYKQSVNFLGEGFCPTVFKSLVETIQK